MMLSTDAARIFSSSMTIVQDVIMPFLSKPLTPQGHIALLRWMSVVVGVIFVCGSCFMSQLDYINLFVQIMMSLWMGGAGPVMIFGLYSRFGTSAGAFASLFVGIGTALSGILLQRNWPDIIYPFLERHGLVDEVGNILTAISSPFNPWIVWEMDPVVCPINSYEFYFIAMMLSLIAYCLVSLITCRKPFNLDRMLHRGKYSETGEARPKIDWSLSNFLSIMVGITPEYTKGDRVIAWSVFVFCFIYQFIGTFVVVCIWNAVSPWPAEWWSNYFLYVQLVIPGLLAAVTAVWFSIGGVVDLRRLFVDLRSRKANDLDNGCVEGNTSLADKAAFDKIDSEE
jgi:Na+/proline symporter